VINAEYAGTCYEDNQLKIRPCWWGASTLV